MRPVVCLGRVHATLCAFAGNLAEQVLEVVEPVGKPVVGMDVSGEGAEVGRGGGIGIENVDYCVLPSVVGKQTANSMVVCGRL